MADVGDDESVGSLEWAAEAVALAKGQTRHTPPRTAGWQLPPHTLLALADDGDNPDGNDSSHAAAPVVVRAPLGPDSRRPPRASPDPTSAPPLSASPASHSRSTITNNNSSALSCAGSSALSSGPAPPPGTVGAGSGSHPPSGHHGAGSHGKPAASLTPRPDSRPGGGSADDDNDNSDKADAVFEAALSAVGLGRHHLWLLVITGLVCSSDASQVTAVSFLLDAAACDLELTDSRDGWVTVALFIGMLLGGWVGGSLADHLGRRRVLMWGVLLNSTAALASAFSVNFVMAILLLALSGVGVGAVLPIVFPFFAEWTPISHRRRLLVVLALAWTVGSLLVATLAWVILSPNSCPGRDDDNESLQAHCAAVAVLPCGTTSLPSGTVSSWRVFVVASVLPAFLSLLLVLLFTRESPRWLHTVGRLDEAEANLLWLAQRNGTRIDPAAISLRDPGSLEAGKGAPPAASSYGSCSTAVAATAWPPPAQHVQQKSTSHTSTSRRIAAKGSGGADEHMPLLTVAESEQPFAAGRPSGLAQILTATRLAWSPPYRIQMLALCSIWFLFSFGYYGLTLWMPNYIRTGRVHMTANMYMVQFLVYATSIPGSLLAIWSVGTRLGANGTLAISGVISGVFVFLILYVRNYSTGTIIFSCAFSFLTVGGWNALDVLCTESFPANIRSLSFGFQSAGGRIGAILASLVFGQFSGHTAAVPLAITAVTLVATGLISVGMKLSNTRFSSL